MSNKIIFHLLFHFITIISFTIIAIRLKRPSSWVLPATILIILSTVVSYSMSNVHYWSLGSLVGKIAAHMVACSLIFISSSFGIIISKRKFGGFGQVIGGVLFGAIGLLFSVYVLLILTCMFTGDCL